MTKITLENGNVPNLKTRIEELFRANAVEDPGINEEHLRILPKHSRMLIGLADKKVISTNSCLLHRIYLECN